MNSISRKMGWLIFIIAACIAMEALTLDNDIIIRAAKKMEIRCNEENFAAELDGDAVTTAPLLIEMESEPIKFLA